MDSFEIFYGIKLNTKFWKVGNKFEVKIKTIKNQHYKKLNKFLVFANKGTNIF